MTLHPTPFIIEPIVVDMPLQKQSLHDIIDVLYENHAQEQPFLLFQSFIIMKQYGNLIQFTLSDKSESVIRFTSFFILFLRLTGESTFSQEENQVLVLYIESIFTVSNIKTICYLCGYLPSEMQSRMVSNYMTEIYLKKSDIIHGLKVCEDFGLDSMKIAYEATLTIFNESDLMVCQKMIINYRFRRSNLNSMNAMKQRTT